MLRRKAVLADGGVTKPAIEQALYVPQALTMPHRKVADGGVTKPAIEQALLVPQVLTVPHRQVAPPQGGSWRTAG